LVTLRDIQGGPSNQQEQNHETDFEWNAHQTGVLSGTEGHNHNAPPQLTGMLLDFFPIRFSNHT
jgi:hypothetical protein